jgi:ferritin
MIKLKTLPDSVVTRINERLLDEQTARIFYKAAAAYCDVAGLPNLKKYFIAESESENRHFDKLLDHLTGWNIQPTLTEVKPPEPFKSLESVLEDAYNMEYALLEAYEKDSQDTFKECIGTFNVFTDFVRIQNESVIEYANIINIFANYNGQLGLFDAYIGEINE